MAGGTRSVVRWFCKHFRCAVKLPVKLFERRLSCSVTEPFLRRGRGRSRLFVHQPSFAPLNVVLSSQSNPYQRHAKAHSVLLGVLPSPTRKRNQSQVDRPAGQRRTAVPGDRNDEAPPGPSVTSGNECSATTTRKHFGASGSHNRATFATRARRARTVTSCTSRHPPPPLPVSPKLVFKTSTLFNVTGRKKSC